MRQLSLDEIKNRECQILEYIDKICRENNIKYFLAAGTLIGAIRHKGFIPWDDDIDIFMTRCNYMKFLKISSEEDNKRFLTLSLQTDKEYYYPFAKIVDSETMLEEKLFKNISKLGVWVDIFPLDYFSNNKFMIYKIMLLNKKNLMARYKVLNKSNNFFKDFIKYVIYNFYFRFQNPRKYAEKIDKIGIKAKNKANLFTVFFDPFFGTEKNIYPIEWFDKAIFCKFENKEYLIPCEYDKILKKRYGEYMVLPPENERKSNHDIIAFVKK